MSHRTLPVLVLFLTTIVVSADEPHHHDHGAVDLGKLGEVKFATSCKAAVRADFSRAVAMLHSFWYPEAEKAFTRIAAADPKCGMAWWGVAMSNFHPLWAPPTADELRRGREAAEKARATGATTARERAFIEAINTFYADADRADHATRAARYADAMGQVSASHPNDDEAAIFHALALLGTASPADKSYAVQKRAAEILNRILSKQPAHPGIAHYVIHSYDYPALASLALPAARAYAKLAPGSPHALHMPSHIFTRLGLWDESIASNMASAAKARAYVEQVRPGAVAYDELHAIDYLVYAHLQRGEDEQAKALVDRLIAIDGAALEATNFQTAYALAASPARYALERRQWTDAASLTVRPANFAWAKFPYAESNVALARAIGAARTGDLNTAKAAADRLAVIRGQLEEQKNAYWAEQVEIQRLAASAWLAQAAGFTDEGLRLMRAAADLEDRTEKHPVTPGPVIPARELLAEMLLVTNRAPEALQEAQRAGEVAPNRLNGTWLVARSAELAGNSEVAAAAYRKLAALEKSTRPEVEQARVHLQR